MTFSSTVAQQRQKQTVTLQRFITSLHGLGLFLKVAQPPVNEEIAQEEITIVVTEPPEELPPEETEIVPDPQAPAVATAPPAATTPSTTVVETPVETAPPEEPVVEEDVVEEDVVEEDVVEEPEPLPSPVADVPVDEVVEDIPEEVLEEPTETIAATPPRRNLRDLLNDLRQSQETTNPVADAPVSDASPTRGPRGFDPSQFSRPGTAEGVTTAAGPTTSGTGTSPAPSAPQGEGDRPNPGSSSREISCRGCDFDYPEEADGAEGQAQVVVETDEQGRVISVTLSRSSGNAALDRAALQQARERVRLNNARAGESYPLEIDFVQPNSDAARRAQERGDRRSITVNDPEPIVTESPTPPTNPVEQADQVTPDEAPSSPELPVTSSPQPSSTPNATQDEEQPQENRPESTTPEVVTTPETPDPVQSSPSPRPSSSPAPSPTPSVRPSPAATRSPAAPQPAAAPPERPAPPPPSAPPPPPPVNTAPPPRPVSAPPTAQPPSTPPPPEPAPTEEN